MYSEHTYPSTPVALRQARAGHGAVIEVVYAGHGMYAEDAAAAIDRFHRGLRGGQNGGQQPAGPGGAGLGLSIVQAIARAHRGQAMLESVPGRGTGVRVWLPNAS